MMKKKLNIGEIANELAGGSAFFPSYERGGSPAAPDEADQPGERMGKTGHTPAPRIAGESRTGQAERGLSERANARTPVRANGKRIITRNSFEIYEDQMDALRKRALQEKLEGRLGSMSAMVREAIDRFLTEPTPKRTS